MNVSSPLRLIALLQTTVDNKLCSVVTGNVHFWSTVNLSQGSIWAA